MIKKITLPSTLFDTSNLDNQIILLLYQDMLLGRSFEDMCAQMYYRGKMFGFVHLYNGQEAVSTGVIKALDQDDYVCSTYRDHVHALSKGVPPRQVMAELFGKETGCSRGRGGSMHIFSSQHNFLGGFAFIGEGIPIATGAAFQSIYRNEVLKDKNSIRVTACFFGDGTSNNGQLAHHRSSSSPEIHKKANAFGLPGIEVDGMDVLAIREVTKRAVHRARSGEGPTLIEALTYRFRGHSLADPDELRSRQEKDAWLARDPIKRLKNYIISNNIANHAKIDKIHINVKEQIDDAIQFALSSPEPNVQDLKRYLFAEDE